MTLEMLPQNQKHQPADSRRPPTGGWSIANMLPSRLVVFLAKPYLAGQTADEALWRAGELFSQDRFCGTIDILGENATSSEDCDQYVARYKALVDGIVARPSVTPFDREKLTISMKPSMFCELVPNAKAPPAKIDAAFERIARVVDYAAKHNVKMTLEAEDHRWANFQLDAYFALLNAGYANLGTVLQTRLFRSADDLKRFDERARVRLVIGIYQEGADLAHTSKRQMKDLLIEFSKELAQRGTYIELATHDADYIHRFFQTVAIPLRVPSTQFETQFLYGVPRYQLQKDLISGAYFRQPSLACDHAEVLARAGCLVRLYLPFGTDKVAGPYCKRRLQHNPNLIAYGIKNLLRMD